MSRQVRIEVVGGHGLVFEAADVEYLRNECGVLGVLSGTLPTAPQQNLLLGLPLRLSHPEIDYLVSKELAYLASDEDKAAPADRNMHEEPATVEQGLIDRKRAVAAKTSGSNSSGSSRGRSTNPRSSDKAETDRDTVRCRTFAWLKERGYWMQPGLRYGGDFVAYPGDPLQYHSRYIVRAKEPDEAVGMAELANMGRLAKGVKKQWLLVAPDASPEEPLSFSVEWAGFG